MNAINCAQKNGGAYQFLTCSRIPMAKHIRGYIWLYINLRAISLGQVWDHVASAVASIWAFVPVLLHFVFLFRLQSVLMDFSKLVCCIRSVNSWH